MSIEITTANQLVGCAFARQKSKIDVSGGVNDGSRVNINLETIIDTLMTNVGRFCEAHLNDFMITWDSVKDAINNKSTGVDIIAFAIRQHGVDSNLFLYSRVKDHKHYAGWTSAYYRKIFAVKIQRELETAIFGQTPDDRMVITVTLKDITDCVRYDDIKYIESDIKNTSHNDESTIIHDMMAFHPDERPDKPHNVFVPSESIDPHYTRLKAAYEAYDKNEPFMPTTPNAIGEMNRYLRIHKISPNIHSIASLTAKMRDYQKNEDDWHNTSAEDWAKYCDGQIGLIAAILTLRTQEL